MSCKFNLNLIPIENAINNILIPDIANSTLPAGTLTGTFNNINFNGSTSFSGSGGNTTTDGYYYTYVIDVETLSNAFNFSLIFTQTSLCLSGRLSRNTFPLNVTRTFLYNFNSSISSNITVQTQSEIYVPEVKGKVCSYCCCGNKYSSCCADTCNCKTQVITPSTYNSKNLVPVNYSGTLSARPNNDNITFNYVVNTSLPSGYTVVQVIDLPVGGAVFPFSTLYVYGLVIEQFQINITNISISGVPEPPGGWDVSEFNSTYQSLIDEYLTPLLNTLVLGYAIQFNIVQ
jgi:hypothetical protein